MTVADATCHARVHRRERVSALAVAFKSVTYVRPASTPPVIIRDATVAAGYVASMADHYQAEVSRPWEEVVGAGRWPGAHRLAARRRGLPGGTDSLRGTGYGPRRARRERHRGMISSSARANLCSTPPLCFNQYAAAGGPPVVRVRSMLAPSRIKRTQAKGKPRQTTRGDDFPPTTSPFPLTHGRMQGNQRR
jgi:hypothetical protein